jgi:hypothetical protein
MSRTLQDNIMAYTLRKDVKFQEGHTQIGHIVYTEN